MNSTNFDTGGGFLSDKIGGFGYGICVSIGILFLITTITLTSYYCSRASNVVTSPSPPPSASPSIHTHHRHRHRRDRQHTIDIHHEEEKGLDEATLKTYPKLLYSQAKKLHNKKETTTNSCCSICLADYKSTDTLRLLPDCYHLFHLKCVDPWLRLHPTCPVCRTTPVPSPMSTPLAEVVPLSSRMV